MERNFQKQKRGSRRFLLGLVIFVGVGAAVIYRESGKKKALEGILFLSTKTSPGPAVTPPLSSSPLSRPFNASPSSSSSLGQKVKYIVKPSDRGTVKLEINKVDQVHLVSDLKPTVCPEDADKMCLHLKDGSYIETSPELVPLLPVEYRYYKNH